MNEQLINWPAWKAQSLSCRKLIEFLEMRNRHFNGYQNGSLVATYENLVKHGLANSTIHEAVQLAKDLGLIDVIEPIHITKNRYSVAKFRLTFRHTWDADNKKWIDPTNEYRRWMPAPDKGKQQPQSLRRRVVLDTSHF